MKLSTLLIALFALFVSASCSTEKESIEQPIAPWTYPVSEYRVLQTLAGREGEKNVTRLVGWDQSHYYFDWSQAGAVISRGTARVDREQFDLENQGALTLAKGEITARGGRVRTLIQE